MDRIQRYLTQNLKNAFPLTCGLCKAGLLLKWQLSLQPGSKPTEPLSHLAIQSQTGTYHGSHSEACPNTGSMHSSYGWLVPVWDYS